MFVSALYSGVHWGTVLVSTPNSGVQWCTVRYSVGQSVDRVLSTGVQWLCTVELLFGLHRLITYCTFIACNKLEERIINYSIRK